MLGGNTKAPALNVPHVQPGVMSSQHFLSFIISSDDWEEGKGTKPHSTMVCLWSLQSFQMCSTNAVEVFVFEDAITFS